MKTICSIIALMAFSTFGFSQEIKTLTSNEGPETTFGGYGGPLIQVPNINNDWGLIIGGKGGAIVNRKFAIGGIGKALVTSNDFIGDDLNGNENASLSLSYGVGGIFAEYLYKLENPIHFSIPLNLMGGGVSVEDANSDDSEIESSGIFVIEPGINLEFNISQAFIPAINLSYRQAIGSSLENLSDQDLSGISFGIVLKFGSF